MTETNEVVERANNLLQTAATVPDEIKDKGTAVKLTDLLGMMATAKTKLDETRKDDWNAFEQTEAFTTAKTLDSLYRSLSDELKAIGDKLKIPLTAYMKTLNEAGPLRGDLRATASLRKVEKLELDGKPFDANAIVLNMTEDELLKIARRIIKLTNETPKGFKVTESKTVIVR